MAKRPTYYRRPGVEFARASALRAGLPMPTAREAAGHRLRGAPRPQAYITAYLSDPLSAPTVQVSLADSRRVGRHNELVRLLVEAGEYRGKPMTPQRFERLVSHWKPITVLGGEALAPGQYRLVSDSAQAIALRDRARVTGVGVFFYERVR